jgi:hypothetical protein
MPSPTDASAVIEPPRVCASVIVERSGRHTDLSMSGRPPQANIAVVYQSDIQEAKFPKWIQSVLRHRTIIPLSSPSRDCDHLLKLFVVRTWFLHLIQLARSLGIGFTTTIDQSQFSFR